LPQLPLPDPKDLRELSTLILNNSTFKVWKNITRAEFAYYGIAGIIDGTHDIPEDQENKRRWLTIEHLFELKFASTLSLTVYEAVKLKPSLRDKWLTILSRHTGSDLGGITTSLFDIKLEAKEKVEDFALRLRELWENLEYCGQSTNESFRIQ
jgi:hypothetical protein